MQSEVKKLIEICRSIGNQVPLWTQGTGGNVSVKIDDELWIKASGARLSQVSEHLGLACLKMNPAKLQFSQYIKNPDQYEAAYSDYLKTQSHKPWGKASMESSFHVLLPKKWVFHFHSVVSLLMWNKRHELEAKDWWSSNISPSKIGWISKSRPGLALTASMTPYASCDILLLESHGIVLQSDSVEILSQWRKIEDLFCLEYGLQEISDARSLSFNDLAAKIKPVPHRTLYPDAAVFAQDIQALGLDSAGLLKKPLNPSTLTPRQLEAYEIWMATQLALRADPNLRAWTDKESQSISSLPNELYRKQESTEIHLLIPMSGQGTRYQKAGYTEPKPLVPVNGRPMISRLMDVLPKEWPSTFVMAENHKLTKLPQELSKLRGNANLIYVPVHSEGPIRAIEEGLKHILDDQPVLVSYCDFGMVWDPKEFQKFTQETDCDVCVVSYRGFHAHYLNPVTYAYSRMEGEQIVEVREKGSFTDNRENEYASCGIYYFKTAKLLREACQFQRDRNLKINNEFYTSLTVEAALQLARSNGQKLNARVFEIPYFFQWGTPSDLQNFEYWERTFEAATKFRQQMLKPVNHVLMPMAGRGTRFKDISKSPKPFILINNKPMYKMALETLPSATKSTVLIGLKSFLKDQSNSLDPDSHFIALESTPEGQALTVNEGLKQDPPSLANSSGDILISSCDHGIVLDPAKWDRFLNNPDCDAAIFTIQSFPGANTKPNAYAYVQTENKTPGSSLEFQKVTHVSVKKPLSSKPAQDHLLVGTFWFKNRIVLQISLQQLILENKRVNGELYLDSVFELMIAAGSSVRMIPLDGYINWGDPDSLAESLYWQEAFSHPNKSKTSKQRIRFPGVK